MDIDWQGLLSFDVPILEIFIRGSAMYLALIFLMRVILKRQSGGLESGDILLLMLLADASSNGMAGDYKFHSRWNCFGSHTYVLEFFSRLALF